METLVAADSLLNMDCGDALSLEQHYCKCWHRVKMHFKPSLLFFLRCRTCLIERCYFQTPGHSSASFHHICLCPPAAQTFLASLDDVITPVTQVTVSKGVVEAVEQSQWHPLRKPVAQLQSKKRGQFYQLIWGYLLIILNICQSLMCFFCPCRQKTSTSEGRVSHTRYYSKEGQIQQRYIT